MSAEGLLPTAAPQATARVVGRFAGEQRPVAVAGAVTLVGAAAAALAVPPLLGAIVDDAIGHRSIGTLAWPIGGLLAAAVAQGLLGGAGQRLVAELGETVLARLRERVVDRALAIPTVRLEQGGAGDLLSRVSNDVSAVSEATAEVLPTIAGSALLVAMTVIALVVLDWRLALASLAAAPIQVIGLRWYLRHVVPVYRRERIAQGRRTGELLGAVGGARTVRTLGLAGERLRSVGDASVAATELALRGARLQGTRFLPALNGAELVGLAAVLGVSFLLVSGHAISVGTATAAALYFHRAFDPIGEVLFLFDDVQDALSSLGRLVGVAEIEAAPAPPPPAPEPLPVSAVAVGHSYRPGHPVLHDIELELAAGEHVALVGGTGAGKTTLARILAGVLEPSTGAATIGDRSAGPGAGAALVAQEPYVFAGTLADDLRLADPAATDAQLDAALARVGAGWARELPAGLATVVGTGGHRLTAVQGQQLALARLLLRAPSVAILDEATAEAGSAGARVLERSAEAALAGRTALVVAHRLPQARRADRAIVMAGGRIVESGAHEQLLASDGRYAALWAAWRRPRSAAEEVGR